MAFTAYPRVGAVAGGANSILTLPRWSNGSGLRAILCLHGVDATCKQVAQGSSFAGHPAALANAGFAVMGVDLCVPNYSWPSPAVSSRITDAYNNLASVVGGTPKIGILAGSGGAGDGLIWARDNAAKVSKLYLVDPLTDVDWAYGRAGYTPAYSTGGVTPNAAWAAEIDSLHSGNYDANGAGYRIRDEYASWSNFRIVVNQATGDTIKPPLAADAFVTGAGGANVSLVNRSGGHFTFGGIATVTVTDYFNATAGW